MLCDRKAGQGCTLNVFKDRNDVLESEVKKFHLLATFEECKALAADTARRMNEYYKDVAEPVTLVALLTGAYLYASLLTVHLTFPYTLHFVKVSSYKGTRQESVVFDEEDLKQLKEKREVVLIDEYVDSGHTIFSIQEQIKHAKICSCFVKDVDAIKSIQHSRIPRCSMDTRPCPRVHG